MKKVTIEGQRIVVVEGNWMTPEVKNLNVKFPATNDMLIGIRAKFESFGVSSKDIFLALHVAEQGGTGILNAHKQTEKSESFLLATIKFVEEEGEEIPSIF